MALGLTAYAVAPVTFGWAGNFEVQTDGNGQSASILHTDSLTDPVRLERERMIFIVNDEQIDITELVSESRPFLYEYTDAEGVVHDWIVGINGSEPANYGYGEFLRGQDGEWLGGYSARTDLGADGKGPAWFEEGKRQLNIPW